MKIITKGNNQDITPILLEQCNRFNPNEVSNDPS